MLKSQMRQCSSLSSVSRVCSLWINSTRPNSQPSLFYGNIKVVTWSCV